MSANTVFTQALADATGRRVELASVLEATTLGAGFLAGLAIGTWDSVETLTEVAAPRAVLEPRVDDDARSIARERWLDARGRSERTIPGLSGVSF